jgi:bifunctional non-homologous end joining protein LigD
VSPPNSTVTTVEGRELTLSNLDKVLYPDASFTKADLISYYASIAPYLLPHVHRRPMTFVRFPNGIGGQSFFSKHLPKGAPSWLHTAAIPAFGRGQARGVEDVNYVIVDDAPTLIWAANLAALELHTPMWRVATEGGVGHVDLMVFDLDPGEPADIMQCCIVAEIVRERLQREGLRCFPKTSGSKGLQLYVPLRPSRPWKEVHTMAHELARELEQTHPDEIVSNMRKDIRAGKILIDWSQNHAAKTTIAPYSLRARPQPTVSTPLTWDEVHNGTTRSGASALRFLASDVLARVAELGDLFAPLLDETAAEGAAS